MLASRRSIVTVEEIVDELVPRPGGIVLPGWVDRRGRRRARRRAPLVRARLLRPRQRVLRRLGRDQPRPRRASRPGCSGTCSRRADSAEYRRSLRDAEVRPRDDERAAEYTADEMMAVAAARRLRDGAVCFVGIGLPSLAANLARATHAPECVLIYESGTIGAKPRTCRSRSATASSPRPPTRSSRSPRSSAYWLQGGRIDVGFLGAAQIDRHGNLNSTVIGPYAHPKVRLPGARGAPEIAASCGETYRDAAPDAAHVRRAARLPLHRRTGRRARDRASRLGLRGAGVTVVVTDLGVLEPDPETRELTLDRRPPGRDRRDGPRGHRPGRCASRTTSRVDRRPRRTRRADGAARARATDGKERARERDDRSRSCDASTTTSARRATPIPRTLRRVRRHAAARSAPAAAAAAAAALRADRAGLRRRGRRARATAI